MIDLILISIFFLMIVYNNIRILYLAKKDNYRNDEHFYQSRHNKLIKFLDIAVLILILFYKPFKYRQITIVIIYIDFFLRDFYIQYKHSQQTKKTGQLVPYAIVIIFFTILLILNSLEFNIR